MEIVDVETIQYQRGAWRSLKVLTPDLKTRESSESRKQVVKEVQKLWGFGPALSLHTVLWFVVGLFWYLYKWCIKCLGQWYWMIGVEASAFDIQEMSLRVQVCSLEIPWWKRARPVFQATGGPCQSGTCFKFVTDTMRSNDSLNAQQPNMQNCSLRKTSRKSYAKSTKEIKLAAPAISIDVSRFYLSLPRQQQHVRGWLALPHLMGWTGLTCTWRQLITAGMALFNLVTAVFLLDRIAQRILPDSSDITAVSLGSNQQKHLFSAAASGCDAALASPRSLT